MYITATKDINGNKSAKILGAIKLTNQKYEIRDNPLLIIKSIYFNDLDSHTIPVSTKLITRKGFKIFRKIYFINIKLLIRIFLLVYINIIT